MHSRTAVPLLIAVLLAGATAGPAVASNQASKWWHSERFQKELGLTPEQSTQVEEIFQSSLVELRRLSKEHERLEAQLSALISAPHATEAQVAQQADLVEAARSSIGKARTMMLFKMRRVLTPEQRVKLNQLHKHFERERSQRRRDNY